MRECKDCHTPCLKSRCSSCARVNTTKTILRHQSNNSRDRCRCGRARPWGKKLCLTCCKRQTVYNRRYRSKIKV